MPDIPNSADSLVVNFRGLKKELLQEISQQLNSRKSGQRSEAEDNQIFSTFNKTLQSFINSQHLFGSLVIDIFQEVESIVLEYERRTSVQVHKGAIYFNAGLCYLWTGDFDKALYYWTLAEDENLLTRDILGNIFFEESFTKNLGESIKNLIEGELQAETGICQKIGGDIYIYSDYEVYLKGMAIHDLKNMIVNFTRRIHYDSLRQNETTSLLYYRLVADYCFMFETTIKGHLSQKKTLTETTLGGIIRNEIPASIGRKVPAGIGPSVTAYNQILPSLIIDIDRESNRDELTAKILFLISLTRNQVLHDIDITNILYGNISLCQRMIRLIIVALLFDKYL